MPARPHDAGRFPELHYRRSDDLRAFAHLFAVQDPYLLPLAIEVCLPASGLGLALRWWLLKLRFVDRYGGREAQVHQLYRFVLHPVAVSPLVCRVEALLDLVYLQVLLGLDRELERLPPRSEEH